MARTGATHLLCREDERNPWCIEFDERGSGGLRITPWIIDAQECSIGVAGPDTRVRRSVQSSSLRLLRDKAAELRCRYISQLPS